MEGSLGQERWANSSPAGTGAPPGRRLSGKLGTAPGTAPSEYRRPVQVSSDPFPPCEEERGPQGGGSPHPRVGPPQDRAQVALRGTGQH